MDNLENMLSKMGIPGMGNGAKVDMNAFSRHMEQNMRAAKMRDRMRSKLQDKDKDNISKTEISETPQQTQQSKSTELNLDNIEKLVFSTGETVERSQRSQNRKKKKGRGKKK